MVILVRDDCLAGVEGQLLLAMQRKRFDTAVLRLSGLARFLGYPVDTRVGAEVVVEGPGSLHQEDEVLDRRGSGSLLRAGCGGCGCPAARHQRDGRGGGAAATQ